MDKYISDFEDRSGILRSQISKEPVILPSCKKVFFGSFLFPLIKDMATFFNERNQNLLPEEAKILTSISFLPHVKIPLSEEVLSRPDGVFYGDCFRLVEMNYGNSMGGLLAIEYLQQYYKKTNSHIDLGSIIGGLYELWKPFNSRENPIVAYRNFGNYERYEQQNKVMFNLLSSLGLNIEFSDLKEILPEVKNNTLTPCLAITRQDILDDEESSALIFEFETLAKSKGIRVFNDIKETDVINSKVLLALYSEYTKSEHIVPSEWLGNREVVDLVKFKERKERILSQKDTCVLKRDCSYQGKHVFFGDEVSTEQWEKLVEESIDDGRWIVQEIQYGKKLTYTDFNDEQSPLFAIVSPFIFGDQTSSIVVRYRLSEKEKTCVLPNNSETTLGLIGFENGH